MWTLRFLGWVMNYAVLFIMKMRGGETGLEEKMISILDVLHLKYL